MHREHFSVRDRSNHVDVAKAREDARFLRESRVQRTRVVRGVEALEVGANGAKLVQQQRNPWACACSEGGEVRATSRS